MIAWVRRLFGADLPAGWVGSLDVAENVLAIAAARGGGHLVATSLGLWVPEDEDGVRRIGWHLISKATWGSGTLVVTEASETGAAADAVLLADLPPRRFVLDAPGRLPQVVNARVTGSIRSRHHRELPGGGAWFVQRRVPGQDGIVLQVRPDAGADVDAVRRLATEVAGKLRAAREDAPGR